MQPRGHWSSRVGFILAAAGSAIGLGNLWKFPYITWHNRGGAFVLVYLMCVLAIGLPIMMAEILVGRKTQKSAVGAMAAAVGRRWAWVGGLGVATGFILLGYYTVIAGWTLRYFWVCMGWSFSGFDAERASGDAFGAFVGNGSLQILLSAIFMFVTMIVVYRGVGRGIERVARVLMPLLGLILLLLLFTALTMDGAGQALRFIFAPNFSQLEPRGVLEALGHSFFTLSLGMGAMITYGSYLGGRESVVSASAVVVFLDTLIAIVATVILFSVIFSIPGQSEQIDRSTAGMLFITMPHLFYTSVPLGKVLAPLFYVLVGFAALTSTISLLEVVVSYFIDQRGVSRAKASLLCSATIFVLTMLCGMSFGGNRWLSSINWFQAKQGLFDNLDHLVANWMLPIGGLAITLAVGWFMTRGSKRAELIDESTPTWFRFGVWHFFLRFVAPLAVGTIIYYVIFRGTDFS